MIGNLQDLTRRFQVAAGYEFARKRYDLPHQIESTPAVGRRENPSFADEVGDRQRGLIVVDELGGPAKTCRELPARQRDPARTDGGASDIVQRRGTDHGSPVQIRKRKIRGGVTAVHVAKQGE